MDRKLELEFRIRITVENWVIDLILTQKTCTLAFLVGEDRTVLCVRLNLGIDIAFPFDTTEVRFQILQDYTASRVEADIVLFDINYVIHIMRNY